MEQLSRTTAEATDQVDEEILCYTVSDEALEVAAGTEMGASMCPTLVWSCYTAADQQNPVAPGGGDLQRAFSVPCLDL